MPIEVTSATGRIVWGHPQKGRDVVDPRTKAKRVTQDGSQRVQWTFGLAVPKADAKPILDAMVQAAAEEFPKGAPDSFAWKYKDGDTGKDANGNPLSEKEGYAGCFVFALSTEFQAPGNFAYDHGSARWVEATTIKCGDHVQVVIGMKAHKARDTTEKPGIYLNPNCVMLYQVGKEIKGGDVDPNARGFAPPPPQNPPPGAAPPAPSPQSTTGQPLVPPQAQPGGAAHSPHHQFVQGPRPD